MVVFLVAVMMPLTYALITSQAWEDFYIAFRHSVHLAEGEGLTYQPGERIQGFTSPLTTLLLAGAYRVAAGSESLALWLFRTVSIAAYALGAWMLVGMLRRSGSAQLPLAWLVPLLIYLLDVKLVSFTVNGMETGLLLMFLAASLAWIPRTAAGRGWALGGLWAGLMWTRPDSLIYIAAMAAGAWLFLAPRRRVLGSLLRAGLTCAAAYLPWLIFAWIYYGSPVPQSVRAKMPQPGIGTMEGILAGIGRLPEIWRSLYLPPYSEYGSWRTLGSLVALGAVAASFAWLHRRAVPLARIASLTTLVGVCYLALMPRTYPWYYAAPVLCSLPALAALLSELGALLRVRALGMRALQGVAVAVGLVMGWLAVDNALTVRLVQEIVETGNRRPIGQWLRDRADPGDRVYLECPGYIGYYSSLEMLDYPGLVSPAVVQTRRLLGDDFAAVGRMLSPEWMVLRSEEVALFQHQQPGWLEENYRVVRTFDVADRLRRAVPRHPGILYDGTFHVLRRRPLPT